MPSRSPLPDVGAVAVDGAALQGLRAATRTLHDRVETTGAAARILDPGVTPAAYRDFLLRTLSVLEPVEAWLQGAAAAVGLADPADVGRGHALRADIAALGGPAAPQTGAEIAGLPPGAVAEPAAVLGALYVLEGAALGGAVIARHLHRSWGDTAADCTRFHGGEGMGAGERWQALRRRLSVLDDDPAGRAVAEAAAVALFGAFLAAYTA